ncbi:MAG: hypothetical protein C4583_03115 [Anaerolineaceae bacterium]|nr:MAG: hypothetical protein C4583_03115 [Anaerolineaceae bacterium]
MADNFATLSTGLDSPGRKHFAITPHDSNNEANNFRGIYVGVAGNVVIVAEDGTALTYKNATAGSVIPMGGVFCYFYEQFW